MLKQGLASPNDCIQLTSDFHWESFHRDPQELEEHFCELVILFKRCKPKVEQKTKAARGKRLSLEKPNADYRKHKAGWTRGLESEPEPSVEHNIDANRGGDCDPSNASEIRQPRLTFCPLWE